MASRKKKKGNKSYFIKGVIFLFILIKIGKFLFSSKDISKNWKEFCKQEKKQARKYKKGKEPFKKYYQNSASIFSQYFVPHSDNGYKPKILHPDTLIIVSVCLVIIKVAVLGCGFFIYSNIGYMESSAESKVVQLVNKERSANNLEPLTMDEHLNVYAKNKAEDMLDRNYFSHVTPDGLMPWDLINRDKYPYLYVGENLARDFTSVTIAHEALMNSLSHKKNILNKKYTDIGAAVLSGVINGEKTTVLVQFFGTRYKSKQQIAIQENQESAGSSQVAVAENKRVATSGPLLEKENENFKKEANKEETVKEQGKVKFNTKITSTTATGISPLLFSELEKTGKNTPRKVPAAVIKINKQRLNDTVGYFTSANSREVSTFLLLNNWADYLFYIILALFSVLLFINIVIKISIQHKSVIFQTLLLFVFIYSLMQIRVDLAQNLINTIIVF